MSPCVYLTYQKACTSMLYLQSIIVLQNRRHPHQLDPNNIIKFPTTTQLNPRTFYINAPLLLWSLITKQTKFSVSREKRIKILWYAARIIRRQKAVINNNAAITECVNFKTCQCISKFTKNKKKCLKQ